MPVYFEQTEGEKVQQFSSSFKPSSERMVQNVNGQKSALGFWKLAIYT